MPAVRVDELTRVVQHLAVKQLRVVVLIGGFPSLVLALRTAERGQLPLVAVQVGLAAVLALAAWSRAFEAQTQARLITLAITGIAACSLLIFGPTIGSGLFIVAGCLTATIFLTFTWAWVVVVWFSVLLTYILLQQYEPAVGLRIASSTTLALAACQYVFQTLLRAQREAARKIIESRLAAQTAAEHTEQSLRVEKSRQRLEAVGRLASGVAHDFNNALAVILSGVEQLRRGEFPEERDELLDEIKQGGLRAATTARQLLSLSRSRADDQGHCRPSDIIPPLARTLSRLLPEAIEVKLVCEPTGEVGVSGPAIEQALLNLILNARDAMPKGGLLTVGCGERNSDIELFVSDTGVGMPPEVQARVFEPFFSTKGEHGTGLGLAMVKDLVDRNGGRIELDSEAGEGTRVSFRLPVATDAGEEPSANDASLRRQSLRVLLVEDDPLVLRALERTLNNGGHTSIRATTRHEAMDAFREGHFDALVSDGVLLDGGVGGMLRSFRARFPTAPIVVCSGYLDSVLALEGIERSEYRLIRKPFASGELLNAIETPFGQGVAARREAASVS